MRRAGGGEVEVIDLDKRIAELKGYTGFEIRQQQFCYAHPITDLLQNGEHCIAMTDGRFLHQNYKAGEDFSVYAEPGNAIRIADRKSLKVMIGDPWSRYDAKAFKLVDELTPNEFSFGIEYVRDKPLPGMGGAGSFWRATFETNNPTPTVLLGEGINRPHAICRAYIVAVEWIKARK